MDFVCPMNLTLIGISNPSPAPRFTLLPDTVAEAADPGKERNWKTTLLIWMAANASNYYKGGKTVVSFDGNS